jgi:DNA-directed RNA polymerase subunit RPC12/RpoP
MIKCAKCNKELEINFEADIEATMWNFDGKSAMIDMYVYCEDCEESTLVVVPATIQLHLEEDKIQTFLA